MKTRKKLPLLLLVLLLIWGCSNDDDNASPINQTPPPTLNIVQTAETTTDLSNLVAALIEANLDATLSGSGPFTVLAPSNAAFDAFLTANGWATVADVPDAALEETLLNHVISGTLNSTTLIASGNGYSNTSATGAGDNPMSLYFDTTTGVKFNDQATVSTADILATNGIIHIVDQVISLPTIVDHAVANSEFSSLVVALGAADGNLDMALSGTGPFTVLAPNDSAFSSFLSANGFADLAAVPTDILSQLLLNHSISAAFSASDLSDLGNGYSNSLASGVGGNALSLYYNTIDGVWFNGISKVITADVVGTNGIIHAIDAVIELPDLVDLVSADPNFSSLLAALTREASFTYAATLSTTDGTPPAPFTVFAPTNMAFEDLLTELALADLADIPTATLESTLNTHVVTGTNVLASGLSDGLIIATLGGTLTANITGGATLTDPNNRVSTISQTDIQATNGVIHVIDKVLFE